ncbi:ferrochelatase-2, chloroplastic-like protein [Tanacetum coccineum]
MDHSLTRTSSCINLSTSNNPPLHARQITCRSSWNCNTTGSAITNLQLCTPIENRSLAGKTLCSSAGVWTHPISDTESHAHVEEKVGVLLLNLGGPETLNDVQPFLYNLFADPDIIRLPRLFRFLQRPLAKLISTLRAPKSKEGYASIGGGSPLRKITDEQADALKMALEAKEVPANVYVAMRYWYPFTEEAVQQDKMLSRLHVAIIQSWYRRECYVKSMADFIQKELQSFGSPEEVMIFFSAHGVTETYVRDDGDLYRDQMEECIYLIMQEQSKRSRQ